jgi:hypothetical protein
MSIDSTLPAPTDAVVLADTSAAPTWATAVEHPVALGVRRVLEHMYERNTLAAIDLPDEYGAFPGHSPRGLLGDGVPPVAPDANTLRDDVIYACRHSRRTVLITAANAGAIRVYCATHVLEEVAEHAPRWASESGVTHRAFLDRWVREYLPLIREIRKGDLPIDVLTPAEQLRIATLSERDPDDVPSAMLSLVLGAFYMTQDRRALEAVYGPDFNPERHRKWLEVLKAGGEAGVLGGVMFAATALPTAAGYGVFALGKRISAYSPWLLLAAIAGLGLLATQVSSETRRKLRSGLSDTATAYMYVYARYAAAFERFRKEAAPAPGWGELARSNDRRTVLTRGCLHTLARAPQSEMSAQELARALPQLGVGQGEQLVRETLRGYGCFDQPYKGRWQAGHVVHGGSSPAADG